MKIIADTHCHTTASTHAYSSILENIKEAAKKNLYAIAITDHGRSMPGAPGPWYFENLRVIPQKIEEVFVLKGMEANILDCNGTLDVSNDDMESLNWIIASIHAPTSPHLINDEKACTKALLNIANDKRVNVIGHCGTDFFKFDYEKVIPILGKNGKLIEINNSSFNIRKDSVENCKTVALICKKHNVPVIINSDSHFCTQVGGHENALNMLKEISFPEELIVNTSIERFNKYLKSYTNFFNS